MCLGSKGLERKRERAEEGTIESGGEWKREEEKSSIETASEEGHLEG